MRNTNCEIYPPSPSFLEINNFFIRLRLPVYSFFLIVQRFLWKWIEILDKKTQILYVFFLKNPNTQKLWSFGKTNFLRKKYWNISITTIVFLLHNTISHLHNGKSIVVAVLFICQKSFIRKDECYKIQI